MAKRVDKPLTEEQIKAIEMLVYGATNKEVAEAVNVTERTILRWKKLPLFREEMDRQYEVVKDDVDRRIVKFANEILQNIYNLSRKSKSDKVRLDASIYLLNRLVGAPVSKVETKEISSPKTEDKSNNELSWEDLNNPDVLEVEGKVIDLRESDIS